MKLLAILIALCVTYLFDFRGRWLRDHWFDRYCDWIRSRSFFDPKSQARTLLFEVGAPVLVFGILLCWLGDWLFGLVGLVMHVAVLLFALDRRDLSTDLALFRAAAAREDLQAALHVAEQSGLVVPGQPVQSRADLSQTVVSRVLARRLECGFSVLFWYLVLGPVAALAVVLLRLVRERSPTAADFDLGGQLMGFIHWLPARVLAFTFCLVGDFSATAPVAVASVRNPSMPPVDVLGSAAAASCPALAVPTAADAADSEMGEQAAQVERQLDAVVGLLNRSLVLWLGSLALWTLFAGAG